MSLMLTQSTLAKSKESWPNRHLTGQIEAVAVQQLLHARLHIVIKFATLCNNLCDLIGRPDDGYSPHPSVMIPV